PAEAQTEIEMPAATKTGESQPTDVWSTMQMKRCHSCGHPNRDEAVHCLNCGSDFESIVSGEAESKAGALAAVVDEEMCPECAALNPVNAPHCQICGAALEGDHARPALKQPQPGSGQAADSGFDATVVEPLAQPVRPSLPPMPSGGPVRDISLVYCRQCGYGNQPGAAYCTDCGDDLKMVAAVVQPAHSSTPPDKPEESGAPFSSLSALPDQAAAESPAAAEGIAGGKACPRCGYSNPQDAIVCRGCNALFELPKEEKSKKRKRRWWRFGR
ncbi:zinc ribbon domain-containing protein, partial [Chloroflexota bacterium]